MIAARGRGAARAAGCALLFMLGLAACAPVQSNAFMTNPATTSDRITSTQSVDIPPDVASHHYEVSVVGWTPTTLRFQTRVVEPPPCGSPGALAFSLLDDQGRAYAWRDVTVAPDHVVNAGRRDEVHESTATGAFNMSVGAGTRFVVFRIRPAPGRSCRSLDFRWDFRS